MEVEYETSRNQIEFYSEADDDLSLCKLKARWEMNM